MAPPFRRPSDCGAVGLAVSPPVSPPLSPPFHRPFHRRLSSAFHRRSPPFAPVSRPFTGAWRAAELISRPATLVSRVAALRSAAISNSSVLIPPGSGRRQIMFGCALPGYTVLATLFTDWLIQIGPPPLCSPHSPCRKTRTALQHDGPDHLGLWLNQDWRSAPSTTRTLCHGRSLRSRR